MHPALALVADPEATGMQIWDAVGETTDTDVWVAVVGDPRVLTEVRLTAITSSMAALTDPAIHEAFFQNPAIIFLLASLPPEKHYKLENVVAQWLARWLKKNWGRKTFRVSVTKALQKLDLSPHEKLRFALLFPGEDPGAAVFDQLLDTVTQAGRETPRRGAQLHQLVHRRPPPYSHLPLGDSLEPEIAAHNQLLAFVALFNEFRKEGTPQHDALWQLGLVGLQVEYMEPGTILNILGQIAEYEPMAGQDDFVRRAFAFLRLPTTQLTVYDQGVIKEREQEWAHLVGSSAPARPTRARKR